MSNVLITSSAAKVQLVQSFKEAVASYDGQIFTADLNAECASRYFSDQHFCLPHLDHELELFLQSLLEICQVNEISAVIPTRDAELIALATVRQKFQNLGVTIVVSDDDALKICRDKLRFTLFLTEHEFPVMGHIPPGAADYHPPLFMRERSSAGGRGIITITNEKELAQVTDVDDYLINRLVDTAKVQEFTIDTLMSLDCEPMQAVVRSRDKVEAGESSVSTIVDDAELEQLSLNLCTKIGLRGHITVQAFRLQDGSISFIEINPRFGGASNLSIAAGLASPQRIVEMLHKNKNAFTVRPIRHGAKMYRYKQDFIAFPEPLRKTT